MIRKVIKLASNTFVVSLPSKWVKQWGVSKGEEIELTENGPRLIVSTAKHRDVKKSSVDARKAPERVLRWMLSSLHKKGYDEIEILTENAEQEKIIEELLKDLFIGFAIVHKTDNCCIIRSLSKELDDQFDVILRRAFLVTLNFADQTHSFAKEGNCKELEYSIMLEKTNNQLTNFCERILNKRGHTEPVKTTFLYAIVWNLEKIADDYKYLCHELQKMKPSKHTLEILSKVNKLLRGYYELFYKFERTKLDELATEYKKVQEEIQQTIPKNVDAAALSHLWHIVLKTGDFSSSTFALHD